MGFLAFAARKLNLKNQINQLSFRHMQLSQQQQTVAQQIANKQQAINMGKNLINIQAQQSMNQTIFGNLATNNTGLSEFLNAKGLKNDATTIQQLLSGQIKDESGNQISLDQSLFQSVSNDMAMLRTGAQMSASYVTNAMNTVLDATSNVDLAKLNAQDNMISTEMENIDSRLKLLQGEYDSVKKAESNEAQNSAPTFGLA